MNTSISIGSHKITFRLEILILILVVSWILWGHLLCSCSKVGLYEGFRMVNTFVNKVKEGFASNNMAYTPQYANFKKNDSVILPTSSWSMPTLTFSPGENPDKGVKKIWHRDAQPIPLPKGELDMLQTTPFKPECCPNTYSNSSGCACMDSNSYNYLITRGGNNVPYSEY